MTEEVRIAFVQLIQETFEGRPEGQDYTWFVEGKEGLFNTLADISTEQASQHPKQDIACIAAHVNHIRFALEGANAWATGTSPEGTWETSWHVDAVTEAEWAALREEVKRQYAAFLELIKTNENWSDDDVVIGALAQLPHMAFHLGAIHQLKRMTIVA